VYEADEVIDREGAIDGSIATLVSEPVRFEVEVRAFLLDRVS